MSKHIFVGSDPGDEDKEGTSVLHIEDELLSFIHRRTNSNKKFSCLFTLVKNFYEDVRLDTNQIGLFVNQLELFVANFQIPVNFKNQLDEIIVLCSKVQDPETYLFAIAD